MLHQMKQLEGTLHAQERPREVLDVEELVLEVRGEEGICIFGSGAIQII